MSSYNNSSNATAKNLLTNIIQSPASPFGNSQQNLNRIMNTSSPIQTTHRILNSINNNNPSSNIPISHREHNVGRTYQQSSKNPNRHTIAISNENFENFAIRNHHQPQSFETQSNNNSSPLSKTPDSSNENWLSLNESSSHVRTGSNFTGSMGNIDRDSDHDQNMTGISGTEGGDESAEDDLDSGFHNASISGTANLFYDDFDDYTTKRLKTFVATTLHNERVYLEKLKKLVGFKEFLEENFNGSEADISVLFSGIPQIYLTHDIVAQKLQEYMNSLSDLLINTSANRNTTSPLNTRLNQVVGSSRQATNLSPTSTHPPPMSSNVLMKESFLQNALSLLASIMEISFPVYHEFLKNYPKSMTILNKLEKQPQQQQPGKRKTFIECQMDFNKLLLSRENSDQGANHKDTKKPGLFTRITQKTNNSKVSYDLYYSDVKKSEEIFDLTKIFTEDILRRPTKLFEFILSLKEECIQASRDLSNNFCLTLQSNIKSLFDNETSKKLREKVFNEINRNIMPKEVRKMRT